MAKDHLIFDTTDANSIAATDSVGAYVRASDGTLITHTTVGGVQALDVNIANASLSVTQGTSPWVIGDGGGSITVDAVALDIRALSAATDSISSWTKDGSGNAIGSTSGALNVNVSNTISVNDAALANSAIANAAASLAVANTAQAVVASPLSNRKYLFLYNNSKYAMYIGTTGVTSANGFPLSPGSVMEMRAGAAVAVDFVGAVVSQDLRSLELA